MNSAMIGARLRDLLNALPDATLLADRQGVIVFANKPFERLFQYRADEVVGRPAEMLLQPELRRRHARHAAAFWRDPIRRPMSQRRDLFAMTRGGRRLAVDINLSPLVEGGRKLVLASIREGARRRHGAAVPVGRDADSASLIRHFLAFLDNTDDFFYLKNRCHEFVAVSQSFANLSNQRHWRDMIGKTGFDVLPLERAQQDQEAERQVVEARRRITGFEGSYRDRNGDQRWMISDKKPLYDADGDLIGLASVGKDITDLKRTAAAIQTARDQAMEEMAQRKQVFMDAADPILIEDLDGHVIDLNHEAERVYGWPREALIGRPIKTIVPPEGHRQTDRLLEACLAGADVRSVEALRRTKDGTAIVVLLTLSRLTDDAGRPTAIASIAKDITELKAAEAALQQHGRELEERVAERTRELEEAKQQAEAATAAKSAFLATMTHEIRTPVNCVTGLLELLALTDLDEEQRGMVGTIRDAADALLLVVDEILDFSKIEAGALRLEAVPLDLGALIHAVHRLMSPVAAQKGLVLDVDLDPELPPALRGDPVRLRQILFNLLSNAVKFTDTGGVTVRVSTWTAEGRQHLAIRVEDTGIGIDPERLRTLFKPFSQAGGAAMHGRGGTGLGLAICRRLVALMGGTISMESRVGEGTAVTVVLAMEVVTDAVDRPPAAASTPLSGGSTGPEPVRRAPTTAEAERPAPPVLVAEDHETSRQVILQQLARLGFAAEAVPDGRKAFEAWRSGRFGLLLTDCQMPEMDGFDLARRIRRAEAGSGSYLPIIALTAGALSCEADACRSAGMDDCMTKPVSMSVMARTLGRWIAPGPVRPAMTRAAAMSIAAVEPIDPAVLAGLVGSNPKTLGVLLARYGEASRSDFAALGEAVVRRCGRQVAEAAHRIKGSACMIGAYELADRAAALEAAGLSDHWPRIAFAVEGLERAFERVADHIA